jgi:hypothetical protein
MKRPALLIILFSILAVVLFGSCKKAVEYPDTTGIAICYFPVAIPFRVITTGGDDLLTPNKLPSGTVEISWNIPGGMMKPVKMSPAVYKKTGEPDQYFLNAPLDSADRGVTVVFSLHAGESDSLYLKTSANSSKPFGLVEITFNGNRIDPKMLFGSTVYGLELVKGTAGK